MEDLKELLGGVEVGDHADLVLMKKPKEEMVGTRVVGIDEVETAKHGYPFYIVDWIYPGVTFRLERVQTEHEDYGLIEVYAVQRIMENNETKPRKKQRSRAKYSRKGNKRR